jgi:hypothetical protein
MTTTTEDLTWTEGLIRPRWTADNIEESAEELRTVMKRKESQRLGETPGTIGYEIAAIRLQVLLDQLRVVEGDESITIEDALGVKKREQPDDNTGLDTNEDGTLAESALKDSIYENHPALTAFTGSNATVVDSLENA